MTGQFSAALIFTFCTSLSIHAADRDWLMEECQDAYLSPGAEGPNGAEGRMLRLKYFNVPPTVRPGQTVKGRIAWETLSGNPSAVVFTTLIGNWSPRQPFVESDPDVLGQAGKRFEVAFAFKAPHRPGKYRIRWIFTMAFKPIRCFYSQQDGGANDPGHGWWSEAIISVEE